MNKLMLKISAVALAATLVTGVAYAGSRTTVVSANHTSSYSSAGYSGVESGGESSSIVIASGKNGSGEAGGVYATGAKSKKGGYYGYSSKKSFAFGASSASASVGCGCY